MNLHISSYCRITNQIVVVNGKRMEIQHSESENSSWLHDIYRTIQPDYPKFFKMDHLSKAGFLAAELLLKEHLADHETPKTDISIVLANRSSSLDDDMQYQTTIQDADNYFPSPSIFVYTLANIVTGEIAIRHKIMGETSFFIMEQFDAQSIVAMTQNAFIDSGIHQVVCGWVEYFKETCDVLLMLVENNLDKELNFNEIEINKLYQM